MIQPPADATYLFPWEDRDGQPIRPFTGRAWTLGELTVTAVGLQTLTGTSRSVYIDGAEDRELTAAEVAWLGGVLQNVAPVALSA